MRVYIYGCNCGTTGQATRKLKAYAKENELNLEMRNSKYDLEARQEHINYLKNLGEPLDGYPPVVAYNGVMLLLSLWKP